MLLAISHNVYLLCNLGVLTLSRRGESFSGFIKKAVIKKWCSVGSFSTGIIFYCVLHVYSFNIIIEPYIVKNNKKNMDPFQYGIYSIVLRWMMAYQ